MTGSKHLSAYILSTGMHFFLDTKHCTNLIKAKMLRDCKIFRLLMGVMTSGVYFYQKDTSEFQVPYLPFSLNLFFCYYYKIRKWGEKNPKISGGQKAEVQSKPSHSIQAEICFFMS